MGKPIRIEMFGGLRAILGDREFTRFHTRQGAGLLAFLAFHPEREYPREQLIEMLWPNAELQSGRNRLSIALSHLRHILEGSAGKSGAVFTLDQNTIKLSADEIETDVWEFEGLLNDATKTNSAVQRALLLEQATNLYMGPLLISSDEEWIAGSRQRLAEQCRNSLFTLCHCLVELGESDRAELAAVKAASLDPLDEEATRLLMLRYAETGRSTAALSRYRSLEKLLIKEELGTPEPATRELYMQIRSAAKPSTITTPTQHSSEEYRSVSSLPHSSATVTVLMIEIENITVLRKQLGVHFSSSWDSFKGALDRNSLLDGGSLRDYRDGLVAVTFGTASDAFACANAIITDLGEAGLDTFAKQARIAIHTGELRKNDAGQPLDNQTVYIRAMELLAATPAGGIYCSEESAALISPRLTDTEVMTELGYFRLGAARDLRRIYSLSKRGQPVPHSLTLADSVSTGGLPAPHNRLIGRNSELSNLCTLLQDERTRLVTLTGTGGIGKTRLAVEVATQLAAKFNGSCWFVSLASLRDPARLEEAIRSTLGFARNSREPTFSDIVSVLGEQPSLIVLDNLEHLFPTVRDLVQRLFDEIPSLTVLATSRQVLGLSTEVVRQVPPLQVPGERCTTEELMGVPSIQMFVDRAKSVLGEFHLTRRNAASVSELCRRLDGIPLAIELLAAHIQVLTPSEMLDRIEVKLDITSTRRRDSADRHRSLRAALEWSWDLLPADVQGAFASLSVFQGGWTLEAASAVCQSDLTLDALTYLCECSLVETRIEQSATRYYMLETVRQFAAEKTSVETDEALRRLHLAYYSEFIQSIQADIRGPYQANLLQRLECDHSNLRYALANGSKSPAGMTLAVELGWFWHVHGHAREAIVCLKQCIDSCVDPPYVLLARAFNACAVFASEIGDYHEADRLHHEALSIRKRLEDKQGIATSLNNLGLLSRNRVELPEARQYFQESLAIVRELGETRKVALTLVNIGGICTELGEFVHARSAIEEGLAAFQSLEDPWGIALAQQNLGEVDRLEGEIGNAKEKYLASLPVWIELNDRSALAMTIRSLAFVLAEEQQFALSAKLLGTADQIREETALPLTAQEQAEFDTYCARARAKLGKSQFDLLFLDGRETAVEQTLVRTLHSISGGGQGSTPFKHQIYSS